MESIKHIGINKIALQEFNIWISTDSLTLEELSVHAAVVSPFIEQAN